MDEENRKVYLSEAENGGNYDLEDILAEYSVLSEEPDEPAQASLANRSRKFVLDKLEDDLGSGALSSLDDVLDAAVAQTVPPVPEEPVTEEAETEVPEPELEPDAALSELSPEQEALVDELQRTAERVEAGEVYGDESETDYASAGDYAYPDTEDEPSDSPAKAGKKGSREERTADRTQRFLAPAVALLALVAMRMRQKKPTAERENEEKKRAEQEPEPEPGKAARSCAVLMNSLRFRGRVAGLLSLLMVYVSFAAGSALPLTGALKDSIRVQAMLLTVMELSVMMAGLDVFTEGILSAFRKRPTARTLISVSCVLSLLDAVWIAISNNSGLGLPFCAVSALSLTFGVWGEFFACAGRRAGYRVAASGKSMFAVSAENRSAAGEKTLVKSRRSLRGFVRRSEAENFSDRVFGLLTPFLLAAVLVLGLLASIGHGAPKSFLHCISALCAASAVFSSTLSYSLPYFVAARCMARSGAAVAGWEGAQEIGGSRRVVVTDGDLFTRGNVSIGNIRILEGAFVDKVISCTGSVMAASGSGLAEPFAELIKRNGYTLSRVENFEPHDGGGISAVVNGDSVCVGSVGLMNLMGIRVPRKLSTKNSLYTAINGALVGIFTIDYRPTASVQNALVTLLQSSFEPVFAIRDFNITPQMIKTEFRMPTDDFTFPAYSERYRTSDTSLDPDSTVSAVLSRDGLLPFVDAADRGRKLYSGVRIGTWISAAGSAFGMLLMFLLAWSGSFDGASVGNVITFMLLWLIPTAVIAWGIQR